MRISARHFINPLAAVVTLAIGIAVVAAINASFSVPSSPAVVANEAPLVVRPWDNTDPVKLQKLELSCYDPSILPIWNELKKDVGFKDWIDGRGEDVNCSNVLDIAPVDLNQDGAEEFLVRGKVSPMCSAVGNCGFWIFEVRKSGARILLSSTDYGGEGAEFGQQVQARTVRGYSTILLKGHFTAAETGYTTYSFDGNKYVESRCVYEVRKYVRDGEGSTEIISCEEFDHRLQKGWANDDVRQSVRAGASPPS